MVVWNSTSGKDSFPHFLNSQYVTFSYNIEGIVLQKMKVLLTLMSL